MVWTLISAFFLRQRRVTTAWVTFPSSLLSKETYSSLRSQYSPSISRLKEFGSGKTSGLSLVEQFVRTFSGYPDAFQPAVFSVPALKTSSYTVSPLL